jgi:hypothetical protein
LAAIHAHLKFNQTPFQLETGKRYRFTATHEWTDLHETCTATGYTSKKLRLWEGLRREPKAKWFSLIGCIDKRRDTQFDIGRLIESDSVYTACATGAVYCFANDVWFMYWNNKGFIDLQMEVL